MLEILSLILSLIALIIRLYLKLKERIYSASGPSG